MSLNVKLAMVVCMGFITGVSYIVGTADATERELPSPLTTVLNLAPPREAISETNDGLDWLGEPAGWTQQFARMSPLDAQLSRNRANAMRIEVVTPPPPADADVVVRLPPVAAVVGYQETAAREEALTDSAPIALESSPAIEEERLEPISSPPPNLVSDKIASLEIEPMKIAAAEGGIHGPMDYEVKKGDTLSKIARQFWGDDDRRGIERLMKANPGIAKRHGKLFPGEVLIVPAAVRQAPRDAAERTDSPSRGTKRSDRVATGGKHG